MFRFIALSIILMLLPTVSWAGCSPSGTTGSASCETESDAQDWVSQTVNQLKNCGYAAQNVEFQSYDGSASNRIANFFCYASGNLAGKSYAYIVATFSVDCSARNSTSTAVNNYYAWPSCNGGCAVQDSNYRKIDANFAVTGQPPQMGFMYRGALQFTGNVCAPPPAAPPGPEPEPTPPDQDQCITVGTLTQCQKPNGDLCATASNGVQHCWNPSAPPVTPTVSPDGSVTVNATNTPPAGPAGQPVQGTITNTTTTNTTITNSSVIITGTPSGGGTGSCPTGQTGTPPNCTPDGTGGTGTCPSGQTGTPPNCSPAGTGGTGTNTQAACPTGVDCTGAGSATGPMGVIYTKGTNTIGGVVGEHFDNIGNYPIVNAAQAFLGTDCFLSGSCPVLEMAQTEFLGAVGTDAYCSPAGAIILAFAGYVLLAGASYAAFRIAFDN